MAFLTTTDFKQIIQTDILGQVIEEDAAVRLQGEQSAIEEMSSYLNSRYDVAAIFAKTGNDRNALIVLLCMDITLYHIHARINPVMMPDIRKERYKSAIQWLKDVATGIINPTGLPALENAEGEAVVNNRYGSNPGLTSQW